MNYTNTTNKITSFKDTESCRHVSKLPTDKQCEFVKTIADCEFPIPVYIWLFCEYTGKSSFIGIIAIMCIIIVLFITLSCIADICIVPCIHSIATTLHMSDTLAGVTVLAFGNGAPDVFTGLASTMVGLPQVFFSGVAGGCMFVSTFVAGIVLIIRPFKFDDWAQFRDVLFLLLAYSLLFICFYNEIIDVYMCCVFITLYIMYIGIVLMGQLGSIRCARIKLILSGVAKEEIQMQRQMSKILHKEKSVYSQYPLMRERRFTNVATLVTHDDIYAEESRRKILAPAHKERLFTQFGNSILPFTKSEWIFMPWHERILSILQAPIACALKLICPIRNLEAPIHGWSKLLVTVNLILFFPVFAYFTSAEVHEFFMEPLFGLPKYIYLFIPGVILAMIQFSTSKVNSPPKWHWMIPFMGFPLSIVMTNYFCTTIVKLLEALGAKADISYSSLGMTLLAWGNSLGDFVSNATLAKNGMPKMGFAACFGAPLFTCVFGAGITLLTGLIRERVTWSKVTYGSTGSLVSYFVLASLISSITTFILLDMDGRRSYGCYLLTLYITFLIMIVVAECVRER